MTRTEFIEAVWKRCAGYMWGEVEGVIDVAVGVIKSELINGGEVNISGFGKFSVRERAARSGRNPRTGEEIQVDDYKIPYFTASESFKAAVKR